MGELFVDGEKIDLENRPYILCQPTASPVLQEPLAYCRDLAELQAAFDTYRDDAAALGIELSASRCVGFDEDLFPGMRFPVWEAVDTSLYRVGEQLTLCGTELKQ